MSVAQRSKSWSCRGLQPPKSAALRPCLWSQRPALSGPFWSARPGLAVAEGWCLHSMRHVWKAQKQECFDLSLSLSMSVCLCFSATLPFFFLSLSLSLSPSLSMFVLFRLLFDYLSRSLSLYIYIYLSLFLYLNFSAAVPRSLPLNISAPLYRFLSFSILPKPWSCARLTPLAPSMGVSSKKLGNIQPGLQRGPLMKARATTRWNKIRPLAVLVEGTSQHNW